MFQPTWLRLDTSQLLSIKECQKIENIATYKNIAWFGLKDSYLVIVICIANMHTSTQDIIRDAVTHKLKLWLIKGGIWLHFSPNQTWEGSGLNISKTWQSILPRQSIYQKKTSNYYLFVSHDPHPTQSPCLLIWNIICDALLVKVRVSSVLWYASWLETSLYSLG